MRRFMLAFAFFAAPLSASAEDGLKGASCPSGAEAQALARVGAASEAAGTQILRTRCNGETRTYLVRQTRSGTSTTLRVTELAGRAPESLVRAEARPGFNRGSAARMIHVPSD